MITPEDHYEDWRKQQVHALVRTWWRSRVLYPRERGRVLRSDERYRCYADHRLLLIAIPVPDTAIGAMLGRRISDLIEAPGLLPSAIVIRAETLRDDGRSLVPDVSIIETDIPMVAGVRGWP